VQAINKYQIEVGGPLHGGNPGIRLVEPAIGARAAYYKEYPPQFLAQPGRYFIIPLYHVFGSEEQSSLAKGLSELIPSPYVAIGANDIERLQIEPGHEVVVSLNVLQVRLPVILKPGLPDGVIGLPVGVPGLIGIHLPDWGNIETGSA